MSHQGYGIDHIYTILDIISYHVCRMFVLRFVSRRVPSVLTTTTNRFFFRSVGNINGKHLPVQRFTLPLIKLPTLQWHFDTGCNVNTTSVSVNISNSINIRLVNFLSKAKTKLEISYICSRELYSSCLLEVEIRLAAGGDLTVTLINDILKVTVNVKDKNIKWHHLLQNALKDR